MCKQGLVKKTAGGAGLRLLGLGLLGVGLLGPGVLAVAAQVPPADAATASASPTGPRSALDASWLVYYADIPTQVYGSAVYAYAERNADPLAEGTSTTVLSAGPTDVCSAVPDTGLIVIRMVGVGQCVVTAEPAQPGGEPAIRVEHGFAVEPAPLRIEADDAVKASGDPNPRFTATYTGLRNGDTPAAVAGTLVAGPAADSPPGRYAITVSGSSSPHYRITERAGQLVVNPVLSLEATGLPAGMQPRAVVNGQFRQVPLRQVVDYGTRLSIWWPKTVFYDHDLYVTRTQDDTFSAKHEDYHLVAEYSTVPQAIRRYAGSGHEQLISTWTNQVVHLLGGRNGLVALSAYATKVVHEPGITRSQATPIIGYLQALYDAYGGKGQV